MVDRKQKINSFEQLTVWQQSHELAVLVYKQTQNFPKEEQFGITSQLRRAASSVSANIAEGFGRSTTNDKLHFLTIAYGSLLETRNFLYLARRLDYIDENSLESLLLQTTDCQKLINGTKRSLRS
jgi:four helix bundle protein